MYVHLAHNSISSNRLKWQAENCCATNPGITSVRRHCRGLHARRAADNGAESAIIAGAWTRLISSQLGGLQRQGPGMHTAAECDGEDDDDDDGDNNEDTDGNT